jgi:hypothetical protein
VLLVTSVGSGAEMGVGMSVARPVDGVIVDEGGVTGVVEGGMTVTVGVAGQGPSNGYIGPRWSNRYSCRWFFIPSRSVLIVVHPPGLETQISITVRSASGPFDVEEGDVVVEEGLELLVVAVETVDVAFEGGDPLLVVAVGLPEGGVVGVGVDEAGIGVLDAVVVGVLVGVLDTTTGTEVGVPVLVAVGTLVGVVVPKWHTASAPSTGYPAHWAAKAARSAALSNVQTELVNCLQ